ncbi:MAG: hexosaminidase [Saprospiraceae bacterium]|jgi:hexosaminidase
MKFSNLNKSCHLLRSIIGLIIILVICSCNQKEIVHKDLNKEALIPVPVFTVGTGESFEITDKTVIFTSGDFHSIEQFAQETRNVTGHPLEISPLTSSQSSGNMYFQIAEIENKDSEAYELEVSNNNLILKANTEQGLFYGIQTIRQLMPASIESGSLSTENIYLASGKIIDSPRFEYRGAMLDVSRHFFGVDVIKRYIDYISSYKMNKLHLHLSDDQGWRIEIKSWPKLTEVGGLTQVGGGKGGFYTQEDYKEIVRYAQSKFVTIIPEIDMPGHTNAALVAYPEMNCNKKDPNPKAYSGIEVGFSTLCTRNPEVYSFLDDVIKELAAMTPGEYIHIGGDESHVTEKEDYIYFINKVQKIVSKYGKKVLGWDDISTATLESGAVVQHWAKKENAQKAVAQNAKVLMTPATRTYLDMQYDSTTLLGLHWAAYIELDSAYIWDPATQINGVSESQIIGVEAALWSETIDNLNEIEYMAFPRLIGHAEIGWSPQEGRNWNEYKFRLAKHEERMIEMGVDYYRSALIPRDSIGGLHLNSSK